ncbi:Aldo/keto reductase [Parathielavia appendiculata]|uniref:Aldo/keto reductase n=1 Tax=Parathielavia appendiculata TaxID=2587402 RepID=A0AAN6YYZ4_9PEZI|nr:Aldo/keto reductase [Parathielavia appendiculata]
MSRDQLPSHFTLNTGAKIPAVGFGTWQAPSDVVERAVAEALACGYRHIDCASIYRNETGVGAGLRKSGVDRKDVFITGKLWNTKHAPSDVGAALDKTLADLGVEYLDLFLMHWPVAFRGGDKWFPLREDGQFDVVDIDPAETYRAMEKLLETGKVKAIGVSNFTRQRLEDLMQKTSVVPAVNQIEAHPYLQQPDLFSFCQSKSIQVVAYSPLGNNQTGEPRAVDDAVVQELSRETGIDGGQLLASWGIQRGTVVLPKSVTPSRIQSNLKVRKLPDDVFGKLTALERHKRFNTQERWGVDIFQEVGEEEARRIGESYAAENKQKFTV